MALGPIDRAASGLHLATRKLAAAAHETANLLTPDARRTRVEASEAPGGGVQSEVRTLPPEAGPPEPVPAALEQRSAAILYKANLAVVRTADDMVGELLDTLG